MSKRSSLLSPNRHSGFQQIPDLDDASLPMANPNDATIDIPLSTVSSRTGARRADVTRSPAGTAFSPGSPNEKTSMFQHYAGGRRRKVDPQDAARHIRDEEDTLTKMGEIYNKILNFSIVTRYFVYVLPLALMIAVPIIIGATVSQSATFDDVRIVWIFTWVEIVWLSLWISKLASKSLPFVFQFLCGIVSSGVRKYALVLKSLEIPLSLAGWALASLATFKPLMTLNPDQKRLGQTTPTDWENIMGNILGAFMVAALVYLGEKLLVQLISIGYHRQQFEFKIRESKHNVYLLSLLYDASRALFKEYCPEFVEEDYLINDSINLPKSRLGNGGHHARSGSATPLRLLQNIGRVGDKVTAAFGNVAHEVTGKAVFNPTAAHSIVVEALEKSHSSEALAKRIWMSLVVEGKESLYQEDIVEVLGPDRDIEAQECFAALDRDGNGDVSLDEMILTVTEYGRERKAIASSLHDVDSAINVLDNMLCVIVFIITIFVFGKTSPNRYIPMLIPIVAFLNSSFATTLATAGTALLSLSFVFASTAQEVLGSCIFLFVKHPFDVGDRVDISDTQLIVERISLLFTVFKEIKTHKTTQVANIVLNTIWIDNVSRSKAMREQLLVFVSFDTSLEDIQLLRDEIQNFVLDKENSRDFQPEVEVEVTGIASMDKMELKVEIRHKSNWSNEAVRAARRSKFMCALVLALRRVPIYAPGGGGAALGSNDQPTYSVAVSDAEAVERRDAFSAAKAAKRMVPTTQADGAKSSTPNTATFGSLGTNMPAVSAVRNRSASIRNPTASSIIATSPEPVAMNSRNARPAVSDSPGDWVINDTRKASAAGQRDTDIEEVRDVLRRQSTRGKRRTLDRPVFKSGAPGPGIPTIAEPNDQAYHEYIAFQGPVSVGPRLPVRTANEGFGSTFDPFQQEVLSSEPIPPQTPPKARSSPPGTKKFSPKASSYWDQSQWEESPNARQGKNNSFAVEKEEV
ncbi:hypothetical protein MMC17_009268 [Xylographa soralifera]|nr:hypothetical protein [Xylographa soralifera]